MEHLLGYVGHVNISGGYCYSGRHYITLAERPRKK